MCKLFVSSLFALFPALAAAQGPLPPAVPLAELVALLDSANPELAAARRETDAAIARIQPAGAPPDPAISAGYMSGFLRPPFFPSATTPDGGWQLGVTQPVPFPGKLAAKTDLATTLAERARWDVEVRRVELVVTLKGAYADLEFTERSLAILDRTRAILEQAHSHAETRFRVGRGPQQDILRAQLRDLLAARARDDAPPRRANRTRRHQRRARPVAGHHVPHGSDGDHRAAFTG